MKEIQEIMKVQADSTKGLYFYLFNDKIKIGKSSNINQRIASFIISYVGVYKDTSINTILKESKLYFIPNAGNLEKDIHNILKDKRYKFNKTFQGYTEVYSKEIFNYFNISENYLISNFKNIQHLLKEHYNNFKQEDINYTTYDKSKLSSFINENGKIAIGNFKFSNKVNLTKFNRSLLSLLPIGIIKDKQIENFVFDLYKKHPKYKEEYTFLFTETALDEYGTYSNFVIVYKDKNNEIDKHQFSSQKCIQNIKL